MRVEILGSAGATTAPRPGCRCRVCVEARELGGRHARTGPSTFVHGPNVLFDTPEESRLQLDRAGMEEIGACFSHWHPDHTMDRRLWETRSWEHLAFMESQGWVRLHVIRDGESVTVGGVEVHPFRLAEDFVYAFELRGEGRRVLVAPDALVGWRPPEELRGVDLAVLPMGIAEHHPLSGERLIHAEHAMLPFEATSEETLVIVDELGAAHVVLTHIEEMDELMVAELDELEQRLRAEGRVVTFAWDGLVVQA